VGWILLKNINARDPAALPLALSLPLAWLNLSTRAQETAISVGLVYLGDLVAQDPSELLARPNVGRKTILELRSWLDRLGLTFGVSVDGWSASRATEFVRSQSEELANLAREVNGYAPNLATTLQSSLRQALLEVGASPRNIGMVVEYCGWNGGFPRTLESVGAELGITRERVRQIVAKFTKKLRTRGPPEAVKHAIELASDGLPVTSQGFKSLLEKAGLSDGSFSAEALRIVADVYDYPLTFEIGTEGQLLPKGGAEALHRMIVSARRTIGSKGCARISDLLEHEPILGRGAREILVDAVGNDGDFQWLDEEKEWFWRGRTLPGGRNRLVNTIARVLAVAERVTIPELRAAIRRNLRMGGFAPPTTILIRVCENLPFAIMQGAILTRIEDALDWPALLGEVESTFVRVLRKHGPVLQRLDLLQKCRDEGMNLNTFAVFGTYSVVLTHPAVGFYSLVGMEIPPGTIEAKRQGQPRIQTFVDSGWTKSGAPFLSWKLNARSLHSGIVSIPSAFQKILAGYWRAGGIEGQGTYQIEVRGATCWNLKKLFGRMGSEPDDFLILWFDLSCRSVTAAVGSEELVDAASEGIPALPSEDGEICEAEFDVMGR
jgi:Sigma-70, region 4/Bacterial RNA polymerase, alpha chain C terminal domain